MSTYIQKTEKTIYKSGTRGKILDKNGKVLAYDALSYAVTIEDKIDSSDTKNSQLNDIVSQTIDIIEKYGDKVTVDFPISLTKDGKWEYNITSEAGILRFKKNVTSNDCKVKDVDYTNATAPEMMNYLKNQFFEVTGDVDNDKLLKIISIRYNIYLHSGQKYITTTVAQDVSKETMVAIQENASTLKGVKAEEQNIRKYNDSLYYAPILGYTGTISEVDPFEGEVLSVEKTNQNSHEAVCYCYDCVCIYDAGFLHRNSAETKDTWCNIYGREQYDY